VRGAFKGAVSKRRRRGLEASRNAVSRRDRWLISRRAGKLLRALEEGSIRFRGEASKPTMVGTCASWRRRIAITRGGRGGAFSRPSYFRIATLVVEVLAMRDRPGRLAALFISFASVIRSGLKDSHREKHLHRHSAPASRFAKACEMSWRATRGRATCANSAKVREAGALASRRAEN